MSQETSAASDAAYSAEPDSGRVKAVRMMVLGSVLAVLGPLGGFLAGSMIGLSRTLGDFDAMFVALFIGLFVGGIGAVIAGLGLLRYARRDAELRRQPGSAPPTPTPSSEASGGLSTPR